MANPTESEIQSRHALYEAFNSSGLTVKEYSQRHGVDENKLKYAIRIYRKGSSNTRTAGLNGNPFREVSIKSLGGPELTVILRNGLQVRIPQIFPDAQSLVKVIGALELC